MRRVRSFVPVSHDTDASHKPLAFNQATSLYNLMCRVKDESAPRSKEVKALMWELDECTLAPAANAFYAEEYELREIFHYLTNAWPRASCQLAQYLDEKELLGLTQYARRLCSLVDALSVYVVINLVIEAKYQVQLPTIAGLLTRLGYHLGGNKVDMILSNIHALSIFDLQHPVLGWCLDFQWYGDHLDQKRGLIHTVALQEHTQCLNELHIPDIQKRLTTQSTARLLREYLEALIDRRNDHGRVSRTQESKVFASRVWDYAKPRGDLHCFHRFNEKHTASYKKAWAELYGTLSGQLRYSPTHPPFGTMELQLSEQLAKTLWNCLIEESAPLKR